MILSPQAHPFLLGSQAFHCFLVVLPTRLTPKCLRRGRRNPQDHLRDGADTGQGRNEMIAQIGHMVGLGTSLGFVVKRNRKASTSVAWIARVPGGSSWSRRSWNSRLTCGGTCTWANGNDERTATQNSVGTLCFTDFTQREHEAELRQVSYFIVFFFFFF